MAAFGEGDYVWIEHEQPGEFDVAIGGRVCELLNGGQLVRVVDDEQREQEVDVSRCRIMNVGSIQHTDDMIKLNDLSEPSLLRNLLVRYQQGLIYTYTGSILIAVNPYKVLPIYSPEIMKSYSGRKIGERPPHIYAIADGAYSNIKRFRSNQCIIISGESGAGKTESTKLILQYLASTSGQHSWVEQQIIESNPIMEAFGNAKTVRNDNSSRFGKYVDIHFTPNGTIESARIEQYLLEKSRLISQMPNERNYHIFYCMCAGLTQEERSRLQLLDAFHYAYLISGSTVKVEGHDDAQEFANIRSAMKILTFTDDEMWQIFRLLTALLYIGNVRHTMKVVDTIDTIEIRNSRELSIVADFIEVPLNVLNDAFTTRTLVTREESVTSVLSYESYTYVKDAFVKGVYGRLFVWVVDKINSVIFKPESRVSSRSSIGLLDIFGFENFETNSFEQLCINYANENLQQFFVRHVFKLEQEQYDMEQINWQRIQFIDNQESLDMIAVRPMNILALVDEESKFPQGTDQSMLNKLHLVHSGNQNYLKPRADVKLLFGINHYAGVVFYDAKGFLDKNRDSFSNDLLKLVRTSKNAFLSKLFQLDLENAAETRKPLLTLSAQFKRSLDSLMRTLSSCQPFFVRCIKANDFKLPLKFERPLCVRQLRYSGMMETIRIRRSGYPIRHTFVDFVTRYRGLSQKVSRVPFWKINDYKAATQIILKEVLGESDYQLGLSKIFLKDEHDLSLELARDQALSYFAIIIQRYYRGYCERKRFRQMQHAASVIQRAWRSYADRIHYLQLRRGLVRFQALLRTRIINRNFVRKCSFVTELQQFSRGYLARRNATVRRRSAIVIQSWIRRHLARKKLLKLRNERLVLVEAERLREQTEIELSREYNPKQAKERADEWFENFLRSKEDELKNTEARNKTDRNRHLRSVIDQSLQNEISLSESVILSKIVNLDESISFPSHYDIFKAEAAASYNLPTQPEEDSVLNEYSFTKFAATYFTDSKLSTFSRSLLKQPLLQLQSTNDQLVALAIYVTILRFMGDLPDLVKAERDKVPMMSRIQGTIGRQVSKEQLEQLRKLTDDIEKDPTNSVMLGTYRRKKSRFNTLRKASKLSNLFADNAAAAQSSNLPANGFSSGTDTDSGTEAVENKLLDEMFIANRPMNKLEKIHFVIGHGILRPELRDEIYSQLCKQLNQNPGSNSRTYGWILMSLCLGCFAPSERMRSYLQRFIMDAPGGFATYCTSQLKRTLMNGARDQPPAYIELHATRSKKPIQLSVTLSNSNTLSLVADSATTSRELCQQIASQLGLLEQFGFSLFVALQEKVNSLGNCNDHLMDAISQCEQYAKEHGMHERTAPWKLYYRKEIFAPWPCVAEDGIAIKLTYAQIVRSVKAGDFRCESDQEIALLVAQQFYVDHSTEVNTDRLRTALASYLPEQIVALLDAAQTQFWIKAVTKTLQQASFVGEHATQLKVMKDVVNFAKFKWPLLFSRFYEAKRLPMHENKTACDALTRAYAATKHSTGSAQSLNHIIAINWTGIFLVDEQEHILLEISYPEIAGISCVNLELSSTSFLPGPRFNVIKLLTIRDESFAFAAPNAQDIKDLVSFFLEGLKNRSRYVVTVQDCVVPVPPQTDGSRRLMSTRKGDLIMLDADSATYNLLEGSSSPYRTGKNISTGQYGEFALDGVYVLPCITPPPREVIMHYTNLNYRRIAEFYRINAVNIGIPQGSANGNGTAPAGVANEDSIQSSDSGRRYTLERYASQYFRTPQRAGTISKAVGAALNSVKLSSTMQMEPLWRFSKDQLTKPLLLKLQSREDLLDAALKCYATIRAYMGDIPGSGARRSGDPTIISPIFTAMLCNELLKDEGYCQIVKQLTANPSENNEERGWELLWLATGCCAPSNILSQEIIRFLKSVRTSVATDCLNRLFKTIKSGQRKFGPHVVEISAIQSHATQMLHKVFFPDGTDEPFEVESTTRSSDLVRTIAQQLKLRSSACFSLYVKTADRVFCVSETEYFFDFLTQLNGWASRSGLLARDDQSLAYQVFFMKKLWFDAVPGEDPVADTRFLYYQELPKLLRGHQKCSIDEAAELAALIYRVTYGDDTTDLQQLNSRKLAELLPADLLGKISVNDWSNKIVAYFTKHSSLSSVNAKQEFLKILYRLPTFGSAFFEVKQTSLVDLPMQVLIMINKNGVSVVEPSTKSVIVTYSFNAVTHWTSGSNWFSMIIGPPVQGTKLVCETPLGSKMDELLTSCIQYVMGTPTSSGVSNVASTPNSKADPTTVRDITPRTFSTPPYNSARRDKPGLEYSRF